MEGYERLKQIREERGYSVEDIAKVLNATAKQVKQWESGEKRMRFSKYVTLARIYDLSLDYIAGLTDMPQKISEHIDQPSPAGKGDHVSGG